MIIYCCSVCSKPVSIFDCKIVQELTRELLEVLLIDINVNVENEPVICTDCKNKTFKCFEFKAKCIYTEDKLYPYTEAGKVDIRNVYLKSNALPESTGNLNDYKICRLCLEKTEGNVYNISKDSLRKNNVNQTFFERFLPEVNLNSTDFPVICEECLACLKSFAQFAFCLPTVKKVSLNNSKGSTSQLSQNIDEEQINENGKKNGIHIRALHSPKDKTVFMAHVTKHSKGRNYVHNCDKCTFGTNFRHKLTNHLLLHVPKSERRVTVYMCDKCEFTSVYKCSLRSHILTHSKDRKYKYNCDKCSYTSNVRMNLTIHSNKHSENKKFNYRCDKCPFASCYKRSLDRHSILHSENREYNIRGNESSYATDPKRNLVKNKRAMHSLHASKSVRRVTVYRCDKCKFTSVYKGSLKNHILTHSKDRKYRYNCDKCPFTSNCKTNFTIHSNIHSENRAFNYRCDKCPFASSYKRSLDLHSILHSENREYNIRGNECLYGTNLKGKLVQHIGAMHLPKDKGVLMDHVTKHSIVRKCVYKCDKCKFGTNFRNRLTDHMLLHDPESERRLNVYRCDKCEFTSVHKSSLRSHILTHSKNRKYRYNCDKCPYTSNAKTNFTMHSNIHSKNRAFDYRCDKCPFASSYKRSLKRHSILHSDNREYNFRCNKCSYATNLKGNLVTHIRTMHSQQTMRIRKIRKAQEQSNKE